MFRRAVLILALLGMDVSTAAALASTPVEKVVHLLEELKGKIAVDAKEDHRLYGKYMCWCERTVKRKAADTVMAEAKLRELGQLILKYKARLTHLMPDTQVLKVRMAECVEAIDHLTEIRKKENAAYLPEVAELMQVLAALEKAIGVLHDTTKLTLAQGASAGGAAWRAAASGLRAAVTSLPASAALSPERESVLAAFLQSASAADGKAVYAPQSATLQGILKDMYDTFAAQLESLSMVEAARNKEFENILFLKEKEKRALEKELGHDVMPQAQTEGLLADTQQLYGDTEKDMEATIEFFDRVKHDCDAKHKEYQAREAEREEELSGIHKALEIITSDHSRELFAKSIKSGQGPSLLQVVSMGASSEKQTAVEKAYQALKVRATAAHSLRLASLATAVRVGSPGHFDQVMQAIDKLIGVLRDEEADDVKKRDQCKIEYEDIESGTAKVQWEVQKKLNNIHRLEGLIEKREGEKEEAIVHIHAAKEDIAAMEDHRKEEHMAFLQAKADDESSIELLDAAKKALVAYYDKHKMPLGPIQASIKAVDLAQQPGSPEFEISEDQAPDATFTHEGNHKLESKGVISILTMIVEDLHVEITEETQSEQAAQAEFDEELGVAKKLVADLESKAVELNEMIAGRRAALVSEHEYLEDDREELAELGESKKAITPDCEWILHALDERRVKRKGEMDALEEAKSYLAGSAPPSMLQKGPRHHVDNMAMPKIRFEGVSFLQKRS